MTLQWSQATIGSSSDWLMETQYLGGHAHFPPLFGHDVMARLEVKTSLNQR